MKVLIFLYLLLQVAIVAADDIDIYLEGAMEGVVPAYIIFAVDIQGAQGDGQLQGVAQSLVDALSVLSARQMSSAGQLASHVALLEPASGGTAWRLGEFVDLAEPASPAVFGGLLETAAGEPSPELWLGDVYDAVVPALQGSIDSFPACSHFLLINVLFDVPQDVDSGTFQLPANALEGRLRSRFITLESHPQLDLIASAAGGELIVGAPGVAMTRGISSAVSRVRSGSSTLLGATLPGGGGPGMSDVFISLFEPRPGRPWVGNLKKLKIVKTSKGESLLIQAGGGESPRPAMDPDDGAIARNALTFWTDPLGADVQAFDPLRGEVAGKDGRSVTRGGAGQRISGFLSDSVGLNNGDPGARQVYVLPTRAGEKLQPLNVDSAVASDLGALLDPGEQLTDAQRLALLGFIRGMDTFDEDLDGDVVEKRQWLLGAVLHSRPLLINYGAQPGSSVPDERIVFGSNDGMLHMLRNNASQARPAGEESWAILPRELLAGQASYAGLQTAGPGFSYGVDGSPTASIRDANSNGVIEPGEGDRVWLFFGLRRGGSNLYALDISKPDRPELLWKITSGQAGLEQLALGFSTPRVVLLDLGEGSPREGLLFGGGYNGGWQGLQRVGKDGAGGEDSIGNAIYLVDAATGDLIWRAVGPGGAALGSNDATSLSQSGMKHSIAAPIAPVDSDGNGIVDRAYVADTGGSLWRVDLPEAGRNYQGGLEEHLDSFKVVLLARLGGQGAQDRRFFHQVDYVRSRDEAGDYDGILLSSGDRANPGKTGVENYAYLVKDRGGQAVTHERLTDITQLCASPNSEACRNVDLFLGWKLALSGPGEKGLSRPLVSGGTAYFSTYQPGMREPGTCELPEGGGRTYGVRLSDGAPAMQHRLKWDGEDPYPEPESEPEPQVERSIDSGPGIPGPIVPWRDQLLLPGAGVEGSRVVDPGVSLRWRIFWREEGVDVQ